MTDKDKIQIGFFTTQDIKDKLKLLAVDDKRTISQYLSILIDTAYSKKFKTKV
jgi:hypothetical protein